MFVSPPNGVAAPDHAAPDHAAQSVAAALPPAGAPRQMSLVACASPPGLAAGWASSLGLSSASLPAVGLALALVCAVGIVIWRRERGRRLRTQAALATANAQRQDWHRLLRVTAGDLRTPALGLLGQAEQLPAAQRPALLGICRYLLDLAEALNEQTEEPGTSRRVRDEEVALGPLLDFAMAQVASGLGPGTRVWRIAPELDGVALLADRRALHQILLRVLSGAALATGDGDWIAIGAQRTEAGWTLIVEDEGTGLALDKPAGADRPAGGGMVGTRGLGIGLSLVRSLMAAHGGSLAIDSTARVGTRAMLNFPAHRVLVAPS